MDNSHHDGQINNNMGSSGQMVVTFKDLEQNLIEQITISVLNHGNSDAVSVDSGFQVSSYNCS